MGKTGAFAGMPKPELPTADLPGYQADIRCQKLSVFLPVTTKVGLFPHLTCQTCILLQGPRLQVSLIWQGDVTAAEPRGANRQPLSALPPQLPLTLTAKLPKVFLCLQSSLRAAA